MGSSGYLLGPFRAFLVYFPTPDAFRASEGLLARRYLLPRCSTFLSMSSQNFLRGASLCVASCRPKACGVIFYLLLQLASWYRKRAPAYLLPEPFLFRPYDFRSVFILTLSSSEVNENRRPASFSAAFARAASPRCIVKEYPEKILRVFHQTSASPSKRERHTGPAEQAGLVAILPPPVPNYKLSSTEKSPRLLPRAFSMFAGSVPAGAYLSPQSRVA